MTSTDTPSVTIAAPEVPAEEPKLTLANGSGWFEPPTEAHWHEQFVPAPSSLTTEEEYPALDEAAVRTALNTVTTPEVTGGTFLNTNPEPLTRSALAPEDGELVDAKLRAGVANNEADAVRLVMKDSGDNWRKTARCNFATRPGIFSSPRIEGSGKIGGG